MVGGSEASPIDLELLHPGLWVGDVIYRPQRTRLVEAAAAIGCPAFGGARMAVGQAAASFELFSGRPADPAALLAPFEGAGAGAALCGAVDPAAASFELITGRRADHEAMLATFEGA